MVRAVRLGIVLAAIAIGFAGFWYLIPRKSSFGMFEGGDEANLIRLGVSFAATILGVILGSFYRQLRQLRARGQEAIGSIPEFVSGMFRSVDMWLGLIGSPILFALLLQATAGMTLSGLIIVALENGFCCLVLLDQMTTSKGEQLKPTGAPPS